MWNMALNSFSTSLSNTSLPVNSNQLEKEATRFYTDFKFEGGKKTTDQDSHIPLLKSLTM